VKDLSFSNEIPLQSVFRFAAIAITFLLILALPGTANWVAAVFSLGFGHYLLSIAYARGKVRASLASPLAAVPLLLSIVIALGLYASKFSLLVYFGLHHIFNEVYLVGRNTPDTPSTAQTRFRASALVLHVFIYCTLLRRLDPFNDIAAQYWFAGSVLAYCAFFFCLFQVRAEMNRRRLVDNSAMEIAAIFLLIFVPPDKVSLITVVCYHFILWIFLPLPQLSRAGSSAVGKYLAATVLLTGAALVLSPLGPMDYPIRQSIFRDQFYLWSYIHITSSFVLSRNHPAWITRWSQPGSEVRA
jgi:hypothetical protein